MGIEVKEEAISPNWDKDGRGKEGPVGALGDVGVEKEFGKEKNTVLNV